MPTILIRTEEGGSTTLTLLQMSPGLLLSSPVLITRQNGPVFHTLTDATSATTSFVAGVKSVFGANITGAIPWSVPGFSARDNTGMVQLLNNVC